MRPNRELALAVRRALATGTIALCGVGAATAYAQQTAPLQATPTRATTAKAAATRQANTAKTTTANTAAAKTTAAKQRILLAQATTVPPPAGTSTAPAPVQLQTVIVTGTMIARPAAETAEAITIVSAATIQNQGIVNVEQALDTISANVPAQVNIASAVGSFSGGGTYADLRGLGEGRTLVLLDGQRLANNANSGNAVDLSGIPFSAIQDVQVLREGASALYGSDAIAGVINFITKKNYQGGEIQANIDRPQENGGGSGYVNFTIGHGDLVSDGYNAMLTASYTRQDELRATQRSFSAAGFYPDLGVAQTNNPGTWPATVLDGTTSVVNGKTVATPEAWQGGAAGCPGNPYLTTYFGNCAYRYSAATDLLPKSDEASALASITKSLPANNTIQLQYLYSRSTVTSWSGPMFYFFEMTPATNPTYYPAASGLTCNQQINGGPCATPPALGGPIDAEWTDPDNNRYNGYINTEQRALVTFAGDNLGWDYKLNLNYSQNKSDQRNTGGLPDEALLGQGVDPNTGVTILSDSINPFGPQSTAGQALINQSYVNGPYANGEMKRWSVDGNGNHPLGDAFNAGTPATLALGFSMEGENFTYATTPLNDLTHAATGYGDQSIEGSRTAQALFFELDVPMAKSLDLDVSDREDRYSDFGRTNNGKVTVRYQPSHYVTFRGAASTGFRAPTLYDLYQPNNLTASTSGNMGLGNPLCVAPYSNPEWSQATCNTQGLGLFGGNRKLTPETSQNFDLGVVVSPIRDMGITLDYYRINLKNTIASIPATAIYGNPTGLASQIVPNSSGTLTPSIEEASFCTPYTLASCGYILQDFQNTGAITTDGIDLSVEYLQHTAIGTFHEDLEGTSVTQFEWQQYTGGPTLNLVGRDAGGTLYQPAFRWSHELRVDWTSPAGTWGGGLSNRLFSSYIDEFGTGPTQSGPQRTVGSYSTWNAYATYKPVRGLTVLFGVQNLLNTDPPFTNASQDNFAAGYSETLTNPLLRTFYLNLKYDFM
jgi:iron complex outermembrane receptor protein